MRASRLALSRSISAFKLSLNTAVRSIGPINLLALASYSSSMLMVVRMLGPVLKAPIISSIDVFFDVSGARVG